MTEDNVAEWIGVLRREVESVGADGKRKGPAAVAKELGYSRATIDLVLKGTYAGNVTNVAERVMAIYGNNGIVQCPILGEISPKACSEKWALAKKIGMRAGNPETLRLYKACQGCKVRN